VYIHILLAILAKVDGRRSTFPGASFRAVEDVFLEMFNGIVIAEFNIAEFNIAEFNKGINL